MKNKVAALIAKIKAWTTAHPVAVGAIAGVFAFLVLCFVLWTPVPHNENDDHTVTVPVATSDVPAESTASKSKSIVAPFPTRPSEKEKKEAETLPEAPVAQVPMIARTAVVMGDIGLNRRVAEAAAQQLSKNVTMAVSVYATDPAATVAAFRQADQDVWLQLAIQSRKPKVDPGPLALSGAATLKENQELLNRQLLMAEGYIGIFVSDDADITMASEMWKTMALDLIGHNRMVMDGTDARVSTELYVRKAQEQISAYLKADVVIDGSTGRDSLSKSLAAATDRILADKDTIIVIRQPTILAVGIIAEWLKTLPGKGIGVVPASVFTGLKS